MPTHLEREMQLLERRMRIHEDEGAESALALYKKFLRTLAHHIEQEHRNGGSGRTVAKIRAQGVDIMLRHIWSFARAEQIEAGRDIPEIAVVAQGGYGRGELNPHSDIDLLFVLPELVGAAQKTAEAMVERVLYILWDTGLKVGHATRTVGQTLAHANGNLQSKTALLDIRLVTGSAALLAELRGQFDAVCVRGREAEYIGWRVEDQASRHDKYGGSVFMQEPNIKEGCGGLRDYHNLLWIAYFWKGIRTTAALADADLIARVEVKQIERAYDFLVRARTQIHLLAARANDTLALARQGQIATGLGYEQRPPVRKVEAFMRDYYAAAHDIFFLTNAAAQRMAELAAKGDRAWFSFLRRKTSKQERVDGFLVRDGEITFESKSVFTEDPSRIIRVFQIAQKRDLNVSYDLLRLIRRRISVLNRRFIYLKTTREMLLDILSDKGRVARILRLMHQTGVLGKLVPEFAPLTCLVQHEFFHRYSADEHTLRCTEELDRLVAVDPVEGATRYQAIMKNVEDPAILYLAVILHDTGKAANTRHHAEESAYLAMRVSRRLKLSTEALKRLTFIVDHHMTMSETAQRRNVEDAETIRDFARVVETHDRLDLLTLMTYVDGRGTTGGAGWSDWKETLIWRLYEGTRSLMAGSPEFEKRAMERYQELVGVLRERLPKYIPTHEIEQHLATMPQRYHQTNDEADIAWHIYAVHDFLSSQCDPDANPLAPILKWEHHPARGHSKLAVVTWDRARLFEKITGSISCADLDISSADIFTRNDSIVVDSFLVRTPRGEAVEDPRDQAAFAKVLEESLREERCDFAPRLADIRKRAAKTDAWQSEGFPTNIRIDTSSLPGTTVLEIVTPDRPALLHDLVRGISRDNIMINFARIETEKGAAIDTFFLSNIDGTPIAEQARLDTLKQRVLECTGNSQAAQG